MPNSVWTVIPRGIEKKNGGDVLHFGVYVSAQAESKADLSKPLDGTHVWTQWFDNRAQDVLSADRNKQLMLLVNGETNVQKGLAVTIEPGTAPKPDIHQLSAKWQELLCYDHPDWEGQTFDAPLPNNLSGAPANQSRLEPPDALPPVLLASSHGPSAVEEFALPDSGALPAAAPPASSVDTSSIYLAAVGGTTKLTTSNLASLRQQVGQAKAATTLKNTLSATLSLVADSLPATIGKEASSELRMEEPRPPTQATMDTIAAAQQNLRATMNNLAIQLPPPTKGATMSLAATSCRKLISDGLKDANAATRTNAQVIQRNLYRLSDDPFYRLDDSVFPIVSDMVILDPKKFEEKHGDDKKVDFIRHAIFHRRCSPKELGYSQFPTTPPAAGLAARLGCTTPSLGSFYRTLTLLARFPEWLEYLRLTYTAAAVLPPGTKLNTVMLAQLPASASDSGKPVAMVTSCTEAGFPANLSTQPGQTTFNYASNLLSLDESCHLVENDLDGESLRTLQMANSSSLATTAAAQLQQIPDGVDPPDPWLSSNANVDDSLPSRSVGISLLHEDAPDHQMACLARHVTDLRGQTSTTVGLIDLIRGYSPEVWYRDQWVSLTKRNVSYDDGKTYMPQLHVPIHLEAAVHGDSPSVTGDGAVHDLHLPQILFRWQGWGMAIPSPYPQADPTVTPKVATRSFPILAKYEAVPKSLPRLRFGRTYPLRVRLVDLAGNAFDPGPLDANATTQRSITYTRHDAVPPPEMLMEGSLQLSQGETFTVFVRRENDGATVRRRCLVPPVANFDLLLQHGKLDALPGILITKNGFRELQDIGSFDAAQVRPDTGDFPTETLTYADDRGHDVPVYKQALYPVPWGTYLPDPMAQRLKADIVDLATGTVYHGYAWEPFYVDKKQWPHALRLRVQMDSSTGPEPYLRWISDPIDGVRTLMVSVPKGWHVKVRLRCVPGHEDAKLLAAVDVHEKFGNGLLDELQKINRNASLPTTEAVNNALVEGHLHHYTPSRDLDFIHAVQKPFTASGVLICKQPQQTYDSTMATFPEVFTSIGDRRTTGKLELMVEWEDPDDSSNKGVQHKRTNAEIANYHLNSQILDRDNKPRSNTQTFTPPNKPLTHAFPDTRYRRLTFTVDSVSRYGQYYKVGTGSSDISHREKDPFTLPGVTSQTVTFLSTSRPDAPRVAKIIPLMPVSHTATHKERTLTRAGGAFRIYVERPWYSSGFGEMLAVVLWGESGAAGAPCVDSARKFVPKGGYASWSGDTTLEPLVTRWAADPARSATVSTLAPILADFSAPVDAEGNPSRDQPTKVLCVFPTEILTSANDTHPESIDATKRPYVSLAAYSVKFQPRTQLYYADVQINRMPVYNTFVRLALARYQPDSLVNRECSPIVVAAYAQLLDGRSLVLQALHSGEVQLDITSMRTTANCAQYTNTFRPTLEYQDDGLWLPAQSQPTKNSTSQPDVNNCIVTTYTFKHQHRLKRSRLIVEEHETWFADDAKDRNVRTTRMVPRPVEIIDIPFWW
jgi:hypothetical protein